MASQIENEVFRAVRARYAEQRKSISEKWLRIRDAQKRILNPPAKPLSEHQKAMWEELNNVEMNYISLLEAREKFQWGLIISNNMWLESHDREMLRIVNEQFLKEVSGEYKVSAEYEMAVVESIGVLRNLLLMGIE
jgi:hypothetical protein